MIGPTENGNGHGNSAPKRSQRRVGLARYTPEIVAEICKIVASGMTYKDAALIVGINPVRVSVWKDTKPEFREAINRADSLCKQSLIGIITRAALQHPDGWKAAAWLLARKFPGEF